MFFLNQKNIFINIFLTAQCYPGEDDTAIARGVLMYLSQGNLRDANLLMDELKDQLKSADLEIPKTDLIQFIKYLLPTLERDAYPLFRTLRQKYKTSTDRDPVFEEVAISSNIVLAC
jgi:hypothetical protein